MKWVYIETTATAVGGFIGWFFGGYDGLIKALLILAVIDYVTGLIQAFVNKEVSSSIGFKGIVKKFVMFLIVGVANVIDNHFLNLISLTRTDGNIIRDGVILLFAVNEGISILENATLIGVVIPEQLKNALLQLRGKKDKKDDDTGEK
ncbi:MAG: phage holin family protein [Oscillospiraceae bacterium]|nr:phage holin family protein [Oscillospiraceae bacterium]